MNLVDCALAFCTRTPSPMKSRSELKNAEVGLRAEPVSRINPERLKLLNHAESKSSLGVPKKRPSEKSISSAIYTGLVAVFVFLVGWAFAPGHTNADTIDMFTQARTGVFHDWHSPIVSATWFLLGAQPWVLALTLFVTLGCFAFFAYKLFRQAGFPHSTACIFTILTCYTPPVLGYLGCVCKDTWIAVLFLGILFLSKLPSLFEPISTGSIVATR